LKKIIRIFVYTLTFIISPILTGIAGINLSIKERLTTAQSSEIEENVKPPIYDSKKPTVAVLLGYELTEAVDFIAPYELFSASEAFNVFAVAPEKQKTTLTGGLDVIPHYSFMELDELLKKEPDVMVIPFIPTVSEKGHQAVHDYILKHSSKKTIILSICNGAENLANTGLIDGSSATTHWGDINRVEKKYPKVNWIRGLRYVETDNIINSAGLTSGIDATLHVIAKFVGEGVAKSLAENMNYPTYHYVNHPEVEQYRFQLPDAIYLLNLAFTWKKQKAGVLLYHGMDELSLISVFDTYAASATTQIITIADSKAPIITKHNLNLLAQHDFATAPKVKRILLTGTQVKTIANTDIKHWEKRKTDTEMVYLNDNSPERYVFEPALEDLAKQTDIPTAKFASRRLEYRGDALQLEGNLVPFGVILKPIIIGLTSLLLVIYLDNRFIKRRLKSIKRYN
jgi:AraC family transcriptional regulator, transcriptional activator FtrA